jgi:hypothetical protein
LEKKEETPQDLSPHKVIVMLVHLDVEGLNLEHLLLALNPGFASLKFRKDQGN